ncbi:heteromeric transposase endonuclease subunit TnsA [Clostridium homopropionicum]|nr:heteromeric transposase endonuclease subunit TnsA [Clostridium homopropionicum]
MARRKSDNAKLKEKIGTGRGGNYTPWLKPHEFGSLGRTHRIRGWKVNRIYYFMSDLELYYFLLLQWNENVIDIREQFPMNLIDTVRIAKDLGIKHPPHNKKSGNEVIMTTDFIITIKSNDGLKDIVRTVKSKKDLKNQRVLEKLSIEKEYFKNKGLNWGIVTEEQINKTKAKNIYLLYNDYFWFSNSKFNQNEIDYITYDLKNLLLKYNKDIIKSCRNLEKNNFWECGEGLNFFKYLILKKVIIVNLNIKLNFNDMEIYFNEGNKNDSVTC